MAKDTYILRQGDDAELRDLTVETFHIGTQDITGGAILGAGEKFDTNGEADAIVLDADADTTLGGATNDQIPIKIGGALDFLFLGNILRALAGSSLESDTINETTADAGVTIDGALIKDGGLTGLRLNSQELTASGDFSQHTGLLLVNHATVAVVATLAAPTKGDIVIIADDSASGTAAHTVTLQGGATWDGTHAIATFNAVGKAILAVAVSATRFLVLANVGTVAFT
jgi:hypothetical protein